MLNKISQFIEEEVAAIQKKVGDKKIPFRIGMKEQDIFCIAGLWERWKSP